MTVYILQEHDHDMTIPTGIFSTLELAKAHFPRAEWTPSPWVEGEWQAFIPTNYSSLGPEYWVISLVVVDALVSRLVEANG